MCRCKRGVAVEPVAVDLEGSGHVRQLLEQPVGIAAADVGEVGHGVGLAVGADAQPVGMGLDEGRVSDGHLHGADVEDGLGTGLMAPLDVRSHVLFGLFDALGRVERGRRPDDVPPAQRVERHHVVAGLHEGLGHRQAAGQVADPEMRADPFGDRPRPAGLRAPIAAAGRS